MIAPTSFPNETVRRIAAVVRAAFPADPKAQGELDLAGSAVLGTDPDDLRALQGKRDNALECSHRAARSALLRIAGTIIASSRRKIMVTTESVIMFAFLPTKFARVPAYLPQPPA